MAGQKGKSGGRRPGGGRKPKAFTTLKKRIEAEKTADAEYAFSLYAAVMHDAAQPLALRLECAEWISSRVLGKPKELKEHSGDVIVRVEYVKRANGAADGAAPDTEANTG